MPYARRPTTHDDPPQIRRPGASAKSPMTIDSENEQYISGDSVSLVGSSDDDDDGNSIPSNLQGLMHHVIIYIGFTMDGVLTRGFLSAISFTSQANIVH